MLSGMENSSPVNHPIFHRDPADYMQNVYREVSVEVKDGSVHTGLLYTIDPVSESVVLVRLSDGSLSELELIMGHAIQDIAVISEDTDKWYEQLDALFKVNMHSDVTEEEMKKRKQKLKAWLLRNLLPIEESRDRPGVLMLYDALSIEPPYGPENCCSTNEIILGRIQGLIKNMPKDISDW